MIDDDDDDDNDCDSTTKSQTHCNYRHNTVELHTCAVLSMLCQALIAVLKHQFGRVSYIQFYVATLSLC